MTEIIFQNIQVSYPFCNKRRLKMLIYKIICVLLIATTPVFAQQSHRNHDDIGAHETGQSQFAAIAEIVKILRDDASTDWENVNI